MSSFLCTFFFYRKIRCFTAKPEGLSGTLVLKSGAHEQTGQSVLDCHTQMDGPVEHREAQIRGTYLVDLDLRRAAPGRSGNRGTASRTRRRRARMETRATEAAKH
jgi:hypothetical protein